MKRILFLILLAIGIAAYPGATSFAKSFSGGGSRSSSPSPSRSTPSPSPSRSSPAPSSPSKSSPAPSAPSSGKSFSGGSNSSSSPPPSVKPSQGSNTDRSTTGSNSSNTSAKPKSSYDGAAAQAQKVEVSQKTYTKATTPKPQYRDEQGRFVSVKPDVHTTYINQTVNVDTYRTRDVRVVSVYGPRYSYYRSTPVIVYHDNFDWYFWLALQDRSQAERDRWIYCHRDELDDQRLRDLEAKDASLSARLASMEQQHVARDPNYCVAGVDPDLQYRKEYVAAAAGIEESEEPQPVASQQPASSGSHIGFGRVLLWAFLVLFIVVVLIVVIGFVTSRNEHSEYRNY